MLKASAFTIAAFDAMPALTAIAEAAHDLVASVELSTEGHVVNSRRLGLLDAALDALSTESGYRTTPEPAPSRLPEEEK